MSKTDQIKPAEQEIMYDSGNELAAYAAKQINYHIMGITRSRPPRRSRKT